MSVAAWASRPTGPAATDASAPTLNWLRTRFSMPRRSMMTRRRSVACTPIWRPKLPPASVRKAGPDHVPPSRTLSTPRPNVPPKPRPAFFTDGNTAIPSALLRMDFGIDLSPAPMISEKAEVASVRRLASSFLSFLLCAPGDASVRDERRRIEAANRTVMALDNTGDRRPETVDFLDDRGTVSEISSENRHRIRPQPAVQHARVDRAEIGLEAHVSAAVLQRGRRRVERGRRAVQPTAHAAADRHHRRGRAVIGALAAVFRHAPAKLGELNDQRVVQQSLIPQVGVEGQQRPVHGSH